VAQFAARNVLEHNDLREPRRSTVNL
jgi:hypothetical protein